MLKIIVPAKELFDESTGEFIQVKEHTLQLEHSLVSISKWESKWKQPFLHKKTWSNLETLDYVRCMTLTQNVDSNTYLCLTNDNLNKINQYIGDSMSATTFSNVENNTSNKIITSERIYYWMFALNIPLECQKWHLNRLMTLIRICNIENAPKKKIRRQDRLSRNASLNAARRAQMNSKG